MDTLVDFGKKNPIREVLEGRLIKWMELKDEDQLGWKEPL
jgi:hypothetical protein